ncbi:SDR family oxidoreductase [Phenylobacterium sp.]|uniref:SDR family oxidoreductase n=1 Tax=Phenylobacterium sp. TaxID=1871053 RepID=UPI002E32441F|nr:SDR family oxidoreductase [Phenylobacterium sp.]HEX3364633.1 SDR family oxidoreductase [Phenylobacterium sp.]
MDLGISGRKALVCAASKGLGKGCAQHLARAGVEITLVARTAATLDATAAEIRDETGVDVRVVAADITTPEGRTAALKVCPEPDILINNAGGPSSGDFRDWDRDIWLSALDACMLTPIELIRLTIDGMIGRGFGRVVNITSTSVKAPVSYLGLSNGARSGLHGFVAGVARSAVRHNVTVNNLLPGTIETERLAYTIASSAQMAGRDAEDTRAQWLAANPAGRFGTTDEFGAACAFLCSRYAGYITGQSLLIDGGAYPGTF